MHPDTTRRVAFFERFFVLSLHVAVGFVINDTSVDSGSHSGLGCLNSMMGSNGSVPAKSRFLTISERVVGVRCG